MSKRILDLFCGRWGWSRAFVARGWHCVGIDIDPHLHDIDQAPERCEFIQENILNIWPDFIARLKPDAIVASSPCEQFALHGMKNFHPNPPYPHDGILLFNHTRMLCETSGVPYVMENVRAAQPFVGTARHHCGPFYLWGSGVPTLMPQGIIKGIRLAGNGHDFKSMTKEEKRAVRKTDWMLSRGSKSKDRKECTAKAATIPPELANCVAEYFERILPK